MKILNTSKGRTVTTFKLNGEIYSMDVKFIQEITKNNKITKMHNTPDFIKGLINLRGQIVTSICLNSFLKQKKDETEQVAIVCKFEDTLLAIMVDQVLDVIELVEEQSENTPATLDERLKSFMDGVYKTDQGIISILNLDSIMKDVYKVCA